MKVDKALKRILVGYGVALILLTLLSIVVFRCALGPDNAFSASDANIGQIAAGRVAPGELFSPGYGGFILGSVRSPGFTPKSLLQSLLSPYLFNDLYAPLTMVASSFFLFIFLRLRKRSWGASLFGSISAFWLGTATLASVGHYGKLGAACFFVASLVLLEKSIQAKGVRRGYWSILCGAAVGLMLLSQQDIGLLFGILLAPYALFRLIQTSLRKPLDWLMTLIPIAVVGLLLSMGTALSAYNTSIVQASSVNESDEGTWDFITQWSMPPGEVADLLAPGLMGWKTGDPVAPYWGGAGQSAEWKEAGQGFRNFRLDSVYLGLVPFLLALAAILSVSGRKGHVNMDGTEANDRGIVVFWWVLAAILLILSFGKFTPIYRFVIELPLIGKIRAPLKFLHNLSIVLGILSAYGVDTLLALKSSRKPAWIAAVIVCICFLLGGIVLMGGASGFEGKLAVDWGESAPLIVKRMMRSSFYAALSAGLFALIVLKGARKGALWFCFLLCLFPVADSLFLTKQYFRAEDLAEMKRGNVVINFLKENQGKQRVFTFDRGGVYNRWSGVDFPLHGINAFWFWQAPRLAQDYKDFLSAGNGNMVNLLQATSVKYALAPVGAVGQLPKETFKPVLLYRFGMNSERQLIVQSIARPSSEQDQVVLELRKTLPRLSLFHNWKKVAPELMTKELFSEKFDVVEQVLIDADLPEPTGRGFVEPTAVQWNNSSVKVQADTLQDTVLLFTQRFQPEWKAYINGEETPVFRCNSLSMGIHVPSGKNEIVFKIQGRKTGPVLQAVGLFISAVASVFLIVPLAKRKVD